MSEITLQPNRADGDDDQDQEWREPGPSIILPITWSWEGAGRRRESSLCGSSLLAAVDVRETRVIPTSYKEDGFLKT